MLKNIIGGLIVVLAIGTIVHMFSDTSARMIDQAKQANERPENLKRLGRAAVRDACIKHDGWKMEACEAMDRKEVLIGMTDDQVLLSKGKPDRINETIFTGDRSREQWVYRRTEEYIYLENGVVRSMQHSR